MMQITKNERHMKKSTPSKTYPTPEVRVFSINPEGLLCASTEEFGWNDGNSLDLDEDFSEWKH